MTFTPEEITGMARACGAKGLRPYSKRQESDPVVAFRLTPEQLVRLAALVAEKAAAKEREALLVEMRSGEVQLPMQVAARWPSVPGSHKYAGAGGCQPGSFGADSEDLFTTAQLLDYGDRRAAAEREACCGPDVTNSAGICAADMPGVVVQKYCAAIRARGRKEGAC